MSNEKLSQNRNAYPKYKVYIYGVEVTEDVTSVTINMHDGAAPNTCQLTLLNEFDKYMITTQDIMVLNKLSNVKLNIPWLNQNLSGPNSSPSAPPNGNVPSQGTSDYADLIKSGIFPDIKKQILLSKNKTVNQQALGPDTRVDINGIPISTNTNLQGYYGANVKRYPFADGAPVFHSMDPVRVFERDPFNQKRWYHMFSGFVSDMVDNTDENNTKTLTIVVEDPTKLFRYTRVFLNPGVIDANTKIAPQDLKAQSFNAHFMSGFNLSEVFFTMFFGPDRVGAQTLIEHRDSLSSNSAISTKLRGIGHFAFDTSDVFFFGPAGPTADTSTKNEPNKTNLLSIKPGINIDGLQTWQSIIDHEVHLSDLYTMATQDDRDNNSSDVEGRISQIPLLIDGSANIESVIDRVGTRPDQYLVDGGRLLMLLPHSLGANNRDILLKDCIQSYPLNSEWVPAGQILYETLERIQFVMYCSPRGDIIIEPPLYDFNPEDFGLKGTSSDEFISKLPVSAANGSSDSTGSTSSTFTIQTAENLASQAQPNARNLLRGPFGTQYNILKRDTHSWESAIIDEKVHTMAVSAKTIFRNWESLPNTSIVGGNTVVTNFDLIPLYGIRSIPITPRGYITSDEGTYLYAQITLNKLNADAHTMKVDHNPNLQLWLNRPLYIQGRNLIGTTKQITHSLMWGASGSCTTTSDIYAIRTWNGDVSKDDPTKPIWTSIGGYGSRTLNYAVLFQMADKPQKSSVDSTGFTSDAINKNFPDAASEIEAAHSGIVGERGL